MKHTFFSHGIIGVFGILALVGIASATITPSFPTSFPTAVAGAVIKPIDVNTLVTAVQNLDKRSAQITGTYLSFLKADGSVRSGDNQFAIHDTGTISIGTNNTSGSDSIVIGATGQDVGTLIKGTSTDSQALLRLQNKGVSYSVGVNGQSNDEFAIWNETAGSKLFVIENTNGNIGIGVGGNPTEKLHVAGNMLNNGTLKTSNANNRFGGIQSADLRAWGFTCNGQGSYGSEFACTSGCDHFCSSFLGGYSGGIATDYNNAAGLVECTCLP